MSAMVASIVFTLDRFSLFCLDVDECSQDRVLCSQGRCENTDGSFLCICQEGYMANEQGTDCTGM